MYLIEQSQTLPIDLQSAWDFFTNPQNLEKVTPPDIGFSFLDEVPAQMYEGMVIRYSVAPLLGLKLHWATEIIRIVPQRYFVDRQLEGPYKIWHHEHHFEQIEGGVRVTDKVHYALPLGILGAAAHGLIVRNKLNDIFAHRKESLAALFS